MHNVMHNTMRFGSRRRAPHAPFRSELYEEDADVRATAMELRWLPWMPSATLAERRAEMAYIEYKCAFPRLRLPHRAQGTEHRAFSHAGKRGCGSPTSWRAALR